MNEPAARTGNYYGDCRDWLRIDLDRKMPTHQGGKHYAPDYVRLPKLIEMYGFTREQIEQAAKMGIIKPGKKYRARDTHANLYDGNEVALRENQIRAIKTACNIPEPVIQ